MDVMIRFAKLFSIIVLFLASPSLVLADMVKISAGLSRPPYLFAKEGRGIEVDIIRQALQIAGHQLGLTFVPYRIGFSGFKKNKFDAVMTANTHLGLEDVFYSDSYIAYHNMAITLASTKLGIKTIDDLSDKKVVAFQEANKYLGGAFSQMSKKNKRYKELTKAEAQIAMLFSRRADVIVLDSNIFQYFRHRVNKVDVSQVVETQSLFAKSLFHVAFRDKNIRDDFNRGLEQLRKTGQYDEIIASYLKH